MVFSETDELKKSNLSLKFMESKLDNHNINDNSYKLKYEKYYIIKYSNVKISN